MLLYKFRPTTNLTEVQTNSPVRRALSVKADGINSATPIDGETAKAGRKLAFLFKPRDDVHDGLSGPIIARW